MPGNGSDLIKIKRDLILILVFCLLALIALLAIRSGRKEGTVVQIRIEGKVYGNYPLAKEQTVMISGEDFVSTLIIRDGKADMTEADCPDQICVNHRPVRFRGETIVCLPHKLVVEVIPDQEESSGGLDAVSK